MKCGYCNKKAEGLNCDEECPALACFGDVQRINVFARTYTLGKMRHLIIEDKAAVGGPGPQGPPPSGFVYAGRH